ncbi:putative acetyltransferase [Paucibacter oligotrophus]|uniref:Putative acetyltransferase n=1 Tax=Roseateles oligotrophus TaxID=1769250 RepID=A0A840LD75_9BURK|nr:GNAT family N-acetyltransferase [Roseateles oligotrophus]MBB4843277.1 putative acetyltransferase [Roseateles oligotrophus]
MSFEIRLDPHLDDPRLARFLGEHLADMRRVSPPESVHALDLQALRQPGISFWSAWQGEQLVGSVALKRLDAGHAELKSMRCDAQLRGRGLGRALLLHALEQARAMGFQRLSLETGPQPFFEPARKLYQRHGFQACGPFADYGPDPYSCFMSLSLSAPGP